jgi:hypothetical protein
MNRLGAALAIGLALCLGAHETQAKPPAKSKSKSSLAKTVDCSQFRHNPDGSWTSSHTLMFGKQSFADMTFGRYGIVINGEDLSQVLDIKCAAEPPPAQVSPEVQIPQVR